MTRKKRTQFLTSIFILELVLVCILSAATCGTSMLADVADAADWDSNAETVSGGAIQPDIYPEISEQEMRAVWISYIEFSDRLSQLGKEAFSEQEFYEFIDEMFDSCIDWNMNTVIVHVRPYGDAFYPSNYFPWSKYVSGNQGTDPGFDPLEYMVDAAHERGLRFEAWLNPYRVAANTTKASSLSEDNPAREWMESPKASERRNVLSFGGNLYYNPAKTEVQELITNGVREIVENYEVDGIHFDDYFYPSLGNKYKPKTAPFKYKDYFDYKEYQLYVDDCYENETETLSLKKWRQSQVNSLVQAVYSAVKDIRPEVVFGISPAGNINNLLSKNAYFVDIKTWLSNDGYVDYICPQIYWSFENGEFSFDIVTEEWVSLCTNPNIKLYIGIGVYKAAAGKNSIWDWAQWNGKKNILKKQIQYCREFDEIDGFSFFSYQDFIKKANKKEIKNLLFELSKNG